MKKKVSRVLKGVIASDKMEKTRVIVVKRVMGHRLYHKNLTRPKRILVHDEKNESKLGDVVLVASCRPLSRHKHFRVIRVLGTGAVQ